MGSLVSFLHRFVDTYDFLNLTSSLFKMRRGGDIV